MSDLVLSPAGQSFIKSYEQCRLTAYFATAEEKAKGISSIGWGHTEGVHPDMVWTQAEADQHFAIDMAEHYNINRFLKGAATTQAQFDAMTAFHYNTGALGASSLLRCHLSGCYAAAAKEFLKWVHQDGKVLDGLVERRHREQDIYLHGIYRNHA
jgi:lysozyme